MHVVKRAGVLAATGALAVALAACGSSGPAGDGGGSGAQAPSTQAQYNPQPYDNIKDGGTFTTALPEISPQFNTYQGDSTLYSLALWNWYNPVLVTFGPTGDVSFNKDYLTDVKQETVDGNTQVTYTINPKAVYNDGSPIDWTAFEATWKANNATNPQYIVLSSDGYSSIASVTPGVDTRQAVVTFKGTDVWWQASSITCSTRRL
jgi:peptide/nickel transport system substrate-binding protein